MQGSGEGDFLTAEDATDAEGLLRLKEELLRLKEEGLSLKVGNGRRRSEV
jgi:hypothetical protein